MTFLFSTLPFMQVKDKYTHYFIVIMRFKHAIRSEESELSSNKRAKTSRFDYTETSA